MNIGWENIYSGIRLAHDHEVNYIQFPLNFILCVRYFHSSNRMCFAILEEDCSYVL